jgi:archaellum component FlaC
MAEITKEELAEINELRDKIADVVSTTGQVTLQIELLKSDIGELTGKLDDQSKVFKSLLKEEEALIKRLSEKYGSGNINFETGEFTPET